MSDLLGVILGAGAAIAGGGVTGWFSLLQQRRAATAAREAERWIDVRVAIDGAMEALADAQYKIFLADIGASIYVSGGDATAYLESDAGANDATRTALVAGARLRTRAPASPELLSAFTTAYDVLVKHRSAIRETAERGSVGPELEEGRASVQATFERYVETAAAHLRGAASDDKREGNDEAAWK
jgi:hypothetical protein